jgi:AbrB family looped-hinge helix DNA binding protein
MARQEQKHGGNTEYSETESASRISLTIPAQVSYSLGKERFPCKEVKRMAVATLTSKGQITIPKAIRDCLGLHSGDKLEFIVTENGDVLIKPVTKKVDEVFGKLHKPGQESVSVEDMDSAIRERLKAKFK